jgi:hypothetical protein
MGAVPSGECGKAAGALERGLVVATESVALLLLGRPRRRETALGYCALTASFLFGPAPDCCFAALDPMWGTPIFLGLACDRWRLGVFDFHPVLGSARAVRRAKLFRYDALATKPADLAEDNGAVFLVATLK